MNDFMLAQKKRIDIDKWYEGCRRNDDPGTTYILEWIKQNASEFRESWEKSLCKNCCYLKECGFEVRQDCTKYSRILK